MQHALGLKPHIAWSLAGRTMMFNVKSHFWEPEILQSVGLSPSKLATPVPSGMVVGRISPVIASDLSFSGEVIVVSGGHNQPMVALGAGVIDPGMAMYATGTSECITPAFQEPVMSEALMWNNLCTYDHTISGMYTTVSFSLTGGNILRWFRDEWGRIEVPGAIFGLRLATKREQVLRSLLEGVAFEMKLNLEILAQSGIHIDELRPIGGGGAKSTPWIQLKADVLDIPMTKVQVTEAACFAGAMLAFSARTGEPIGSIVKRWVKTGRVIKPDRENADFYREQFERYKKLYPSLKEVMKGALP